MSTKFDGLADVLKKSIGRHVTLHLKSRGDDSFVVQGILKAVTEEYIQVDLFAANKNEGECFINRKFTMLVFLDMWKDPAE